MVCEGMIVTRLAVNGEAVELGGAPVGGRGRGAAAAPRRLSASGLDQTLARITLATPIAPKSTAKVEV